MAGEQTSSARSAPGGIVVPLFCLLAFLSVVYLVYRTAGSSDSAKKEPVPIRVVRSDVRDSAPPLPTMSKPVTVEPLPSATVSVDDIANASLIAETERRTYEEQLKSGM